MVTCISIYVHNGVGRTTFGEYKDTLLGTSGNGPSQLSVLGIANLEIVLLLNISEASLSK